MSETADSSAKITALVANSARRSIAETVDEMVRKRIEEIGVVAYELGWRAALVAEEAFGGHPTDVAMADSSRQYRMMLRIGMEEEE